MPTLDLPTIAARLNWSRRRLAEFLDDDEKNLRDVEAGQRIMPERWRPLLRAAERAGNILQKAKADALERGPASAPDS